MIVITFWQDQNEKNITFWQDQFILKKLNLCNNHVFIKIL